MNSIKTILFTAIVGLIYTPCCFAQKAPISVYGYLDLTLRDFGEREFPNGSKENPPPTFILLRTHILLNSRFSENWMAFVNLRSQSGAGQDASEDQADKGEIRILEAWFEYRYRDWLRIRGGQFLADFGYFNTRKFHSPIFNTVVLPVMHEEEFLRRASAGTIIPPLQNLQILGKLQSENWTLGYNLYTGNGSSTDQDNLDINKNKGLGTRLWVEPVALNLTVGVSYFTEEGIFKIRPHLDMKAMMMSAQSLGILMSEVVPILPPVKESETRSTLGVDIRLLWKNLEVRGEFVNSNISGLQIVDASAISDTTQSYTFDDDAFSKMFYYFHINYAIYDKITPYFEVNVFKDPRHFAFRNKLQRLTVGVSYRPLSNVVIKGEYHNHIFGDKFNKSPMNFKSFPMFWSGISILFN